MNAKMRAALALVALALLSAAIWWVRAGDAIPADRIEVAGHVRAESRTVVAPAIAYPTPDFTVGIPAQKSAGMSAAGGASGGSAAAASAAKRAAASAGMPSIAGVVASVTVSQGDWVEAGEIVAVLDTRMLDLGVDQAKAAATRARADVGLLGDTIETIEDNQSALSSAKGKLASGRRQLTSTRAQLVKTRATLVSSRSKAAAGRSAIKAQIAQLESIPGTLPPQQAAMLAALKAKLREVNAGIAKIDAGIAKLRAGIAKIDSALAKLPSASRKLGTASSSLADAKAQVKDARSTLRIVADAREIGVALARARRAAATITAPEAGVVTFTRSAGTVAMVGAPIVRIRPDGPQLVDTYLTYDQLARVSMGMAVEASCDSLPEKTFSGRITQIGITSEFPPTGFPTDIVHMTRAVRVTVSLDETGALPAGTPADLTIRTN